MEARGGSQSSYKIKEGTRLIAENAFDYFQGLTSIDIPNSVTHIGARAFKNRDLTSITIPNSVTCIGVEAFSNCSRLESAVLPKSMNFIGNRAFDVCTALTSVNLPEGITSIEDALFGACESLTSIKIPSSVNYIGKFAFSGCTALTSINIPDSVTSISGYAFRDCQSLTSISLSDGVTSIGDNAFQRCYALTSLTIGKSVTSIPSGTFSQSPLRSIVSKVVAPQSGLSMPFSDATLSHTPLYIPEGSYWNYIYDCYWYRFNIIKEFASSPLEVSESKAYMIADANGFNYTVYESGGLKNIEYSYALDESKLGTCWQILRDGSHRYLYSHAAGRYATMKNGKLQLTSAPVEIELSEQNGTLTINGTKCMLVLNTEMEDTDAINETPALNSKSNVIYDLQGRKVQNVRNGLYIQNGKKVMIR